MNDDAKLIMISFCNLMLISSYVPNPLDNDTPKNSITARFSHAYNIA